MGTGAEWSNPCRCFSWSKARAAPCWKPWKRTHPVLMVKLLTPLMLEKEGWVLQREQSFWFRHSVFICQKKEERTKEKFFFFFYFLFCRLVEVYKASLIPFKLGKQNEKYPENSKTPPAGLFLTLDAFKSVLLLYSLLVWSNNSLLLQVVTMQMLPHGQPRVPCTVRGFLMKVHLNHCCPWSRLCK